MKILFIFLLMIFSLPVKVNPDNQLQLIKECNSGESNHLNSQEAYNFGIHIQNLITNKDIEGIFQVVLSKELIKCFFAFILNNISYIMDRKFKT